MDVLIVRDFVESAACGSTSVVVVTFNGYVQIPGRCSWQRPGSPEAENFPDWSSNRVHAISLPQSSTAKQPAEESDHAIDEHLEDHRYHVDGIFPGRHCPRSFSSGGAGAITGGGGGRRIGRDFQQGPDIGHVFLDDLRRHTVDHASAHLHDAPGQIDTGFDLYFGAGVVGHRDQPGDDVPLTVPPPRSLPVASILTVWLA